MSTFTRSVRNVIDAHLDISNGAIENINGSLVTGWTTQIVQYFSNPNIGNSTIALTEYNNVKDSNGNFPVDDGVDVVGNTATVSSLPGNVGLRHQHQQMQAIKGLNNNFTTNSGTSMGGDDPLAIGGTASSSLSNGISQVSDGGGTYKSNNISLGHMRGFQYHQNSNGIWNASTGQGSTVEHTMNVGPIQIGNI